MHAEAGWATNEAGEHTLRGERWWSLRPSLWRHSHLTSSSSEEGPPAMPPPSTAGAPASHRPGREGKGRRYLSAPWVHPGQGAPRDGGRLPDGRGAKEYGIGVDGWTVDFSATQARKRKVIDQQHKGLRACSSGARSPPSRDGHPGRARWSGSRARRRATEITAPPSSWPPDRSPDIPGFGSTGVRPHQSTRSSTSSSSGVAAVIGGGAIGCEFASMLADLGTR